MREDGEVRSMMINEDDDRSGGDQGEYEDAEDRIDILLSVYLRKRAFWYGTKAL